MWATTYRIEVIEMEAKQEVMLSATVRFPAGELERIDLAAQKVGMSRSEYIRCLVRVSSNARSVEVLEQLASVLRGLQIAQCDYLRALGIMLEMAATCEKALRDKALRDIVEVEILVATELAAKLLNLEAEVSGAIADLRTESGDSAARKA